MYIRIGRNILNAADRTVFQSCKSINAAKRMSRFLQSKESGCIRVEQEPRRKVRRI